MALPNPSMTFTPFDVLPASDLNDLVENIESLADGTGLDSTFYDNAGIWWEELGRTTLGVAGDTITVNSIPARKYLYILYILIPTGGNITAAPTFNADTGNNYAARVGANNTADATSGSRANLIWDANTAAAQTHSGYAYVAQNLAAQEKLVTGYTVRNSTGASNTPDRIAHAGKWTNTSAQISRIDMVNLGTGDYAIGSEVVVLGHN